MENVKKVFVIGLDSAPPELLFDRLLDDLPNIKKLLEKSIYGPMQSTIPAITIPAWMVMATGKTPGELGLYGFRHRKKGTYNDIWIAHALMVKEKAVWHYIAEKGKKINFSWRSAELSTKANQRLPRELFYNPRCFS